MKKRFTLIELLLVVAIFGILVSILMPSLSRARYKAKLAVDLSNEHQVYVGLHLYAKSNNQRLVYPSDVFKDQPWAAYQAKRHAGKVVDAPIHTGHLYADGYIPDFRVFYCPIANEGDVGGARYGDYVDKNDGSWSTYSSSSYAGTKVRTGYLVNVLKYRFMGDDPSVPSGTLDFGDNGPLIYDWLLSGDKLHHTSDWSVTMMDGSGKIRKSKSLYNKLLSGYNANNVSKHLNAIYDLTR